MSFFKNNKLNYSNRFLVTLRHRSIHILSIKNVVCVHSNSIEDFDSKATELFSRINIGLTEF